MLAALDVSNVSVCMPWRSVLADGGYSSPAVRAIVSSPADRYECIDDRHKDRRTNKSGAKCHMQSMCRVALDIASTYADVPNQKVSHK